MPFAENVRRDGDLPPLAASQVLVHNGTLYVVGGSDFENGPSDLVYTLPLTTRLPAGRTPPAQSLVSRQPLPARLAGPLVGFSSNKAGHARIRVLGGLTLNGQGRWVFPLRRSYEYNVTADAWTSLHWPAGSSGTDQASVVIPAEAGVDTNIRADAQFVWAFGGRVDGPGDSKMRDGMVQIAINSDPITVQTLNRPRGEQNWPSPRSAPLVMGLNDTHVFVSGGFVERGGRGIEYLTDWWLYNVPDAKWTRGEQIMVAGRASHRGVLVSDRYLVQTGGWTRNAAAPFLEYIDLFTGRVTALSIPRSANDPAPVPVPTLTMHNSIVIRNQLLLFGGYAEFNQTLPALRHNPNLFIAQIDTRPNDPAAPIRSLWLTAYVPAGANDSTSDSTGEQSADTPALGAHSKLSVALISGAVSACVVFLMFGLVFGFVYTRRRDTCSAIFGRGNRPNRHPSARSKLSFSPIPNRPHLYTVPASSSCANQSDPPTHDPPSRPPRPSSEYSSFMSLPGRIKEPTTHLLDGVRHYRDPTAGAEFHSDWSFALYGPRASNRSAAEERVVSEVESKVSRISSWDAGGGAILATNSTGYAFQAGPQVDAGEGPEVGEESCEIADSPPSVLQQLVRQYQISSRASSTDHATAAKPQLRTPSKSPRPRPLAVPPSITPSTAESPAAFLRLHQRLATTSTHQTTQSSLFDSPLSPIQPHPSRRLPSSLLTARQPASFSSAPRPTANVRDSLSDTGRHKSQSQHLLHASRGAHPRHPLHPVSTATASDSVPSTNASPRLVPIESLPRASQPRSTSVPADIVAAVMFTTNPRLQPPPANGGGSPMPASAELDLTAEARRPPLRPSQLRPVSTFTSGSSATVLIPRSGGETRPDSAEVEESSVVDIANTGQRAMHPFTRSYEAYDVDPDNDHQAVAAAVDSTLPSYILARSVSDSPRASSTSPDDPNATHNDGRDSEDVVISAGTILHINPAAATAPVVSAPPAIRLAPPHLRPAMGESIATVAYGGGAGHQTGYFVASSRVPSGNPPSGCPAVREVSFPLPAARSASSFTASGPPPPTCGGDRGSSIANSGQAMDDSGAELDQSMRSSRSGVSTGTASEYELSK